ncbi:hypothetical protein VNO77_37377 [Canavalia gladiata]|uniref:Prolamin-like domain-containing protein n=1 Tax=Canavalia gladiata TaxID=3824 RepID=A0AAN9KAG7_CANGL
MGRLSTYLIVVALFLGTTIATISGFEEETLVECSKHIGVQCGKEVVNKLISDDEDETILPLECCYKLYQAGDHCHTRLTIYILQTNSHFKYANWSQVLSKNEFIFHKCDLRTQPGSARFMAKCTETLGTQCGQEIYNKLINDKNISKQCCQKLVNVGQLCHVNMAKALIRVPRMRHVDAIQLLMKNRKIFQDCLHAQ